MAHLERVGSFLIIENKKSSYGNVYKLKCDSVTLVISPVCLVTPGSGCGAPQWCQHVVALSGCMHMWESGCHRSFHFSLLSAPFKCQSFVWCYNWFSLYKWIIVLGTCGILVCCIFLSCAADLSCKISVFHIILPEGQPDSCNYLKENIFLLKQLYNFKCLELLTSKELLFKDWSSLGLNLDVYQTLQFPWKEVKSLSYLC